ncbi:MAG: ATP-grasp domain-containing protein, partial [Candidatus Omnitrophica bacterium]|nr:ATP-grasp domain-containing protein [Candidatus Omnitrophota bacterium]
QVSPSFNSYNFIPRILEICEQFGVQCLIPVIDEELLMFASHREDFEKRNIKLIINNKGTIRLTKNKYLTRKFCEKENILAPKTFLKKDIKDLDTQKLNYPLIIKPLVGRGSRDVVKIKNKKELYFFKDYFDNFIIQEFIEGQEYTIDIVASPCGRVLQAIPRKRIETKAGMSYKAMITKDRRLIDYGMYIAKKFHIDGPANIQCMVNKKGIYLIEVNPKFAAGLPLTVAAGVNIPLLLVKLAFGLKVKEEELDFKDKIFMLRYWEEAFVPEEEIFK